MSKTNKEQPKVVNSVLYAKASEEVKEKVKADLSKPDPSHERILATLDGTNTNKNNNEHSTENRTKSNKDE
jgi:hypothetical protein